MSGWIDGWVSGGGGPEKKKRKLPPHLKESIHFVKQSVDLGVCLVYNTSHGQMINSLCWSGPTW